MQADSAEADSPVVQKDDAEADPPVVQRDEAEADPPVLHQDEAEADPPVVQQDEAEADPPIVQHDDAPEDEAPPQRNLFQLLKAVFSWPSDSIEKFVFSTNILIFLLAVAAYVYYGWLIFFESYYTILSPLVLRSPQAPTIILSYATLMFIVSILGMYSYLIKDFSEPIAYLWGAPLLAVVMLFFVYIHELGTPISEEIIEKAMYNTIGNDKHAEKLLNFYQATNKCCGVRGVHDWFQSGVWGNNYTLPSSCCGRFDNEYMTYALYQTCNMDPEKGCIIPFSQWIESHFRSIQGYLGLLYLFTTVCTIFNVTLYRIKQRQNEEPVGFHAGEGDDEGEVLMPFQ